MFMRVDLPAPFSPRSPCTSAFASSKSISSFATTPGNRFVIPRSSRRGASAMGWKRKGGGQPPTPLYVAASLSAERCGRVDPATDQLLPSLVDGVLHLLRDCVRIGSEQLGIGELLDTEEAVRSALERAVLLGFDRLEDREIERFQRARDHAVASERLVGVDADRHHAFLARRVERSEAAVARDLEDDVGALGDLIERDLLALRLVDEVLGVGVQELDVG